jgi:ApaG protein
MYTEITRSIRITVRPAFLEDQSLPDQGYFVWSYQIRIENLGDETVQLRSRLWRITDALGRTVETGGEGVIGEQPVLRPGDRFEYESGAPLPTPSGIMAGLYRMETPDGEQFEVKIPAFSLDSPHQNAQRH